MRAALYARVSTEEQVKKFGLGSQLRELRALAVRKGFSVLPGAEYVDDGYSGAELDRPALARLREGARAGEFQVILTHDPDRLARRLSHQLVLLEEFERAGVQLEFFAVPNDDTPEGRLLVHVKGVIAEYEREKIRERTMRGKREKARRGLIVAGPLPYGYRPDPTVPGRLLVHDDEASVVRMVFNWLVNEARSIRDITAELRRLGVRPRRSAFWSKSSVRRLLTNEVYVGRAYFNRRERTGEDGRVRLRPKEEWIPVDVPAIVPEALFAQAQMQLTRNRDRLIGRPPVRFYLLRGLVRCGICGRRYVGIPAHGRRVYRCSGRDRLASGSGCRARPESAEALERFIWGTVVEILRQPHVLAEKLEAHRTTIGARDVEIRSRGEHLARELGKVEREEARLLDAYVHEELQVPALKARLTEVSTRKAALVADLARTHAEMASHAAVAARQDGIQAFCRLALRGITRLAPEGRQRLLQALIDEVLLREDGIELHGVLPGRWTPPSDARKRAKSQPFVPAGRCDLQPSLGVSVATDVGEVEAVAVDRGGRPTVHARWPDLALPVEVLDRVVQGRDADRLDPGDHGRLGGAVRGHEQGAEALASGVQGDRQHAAHRAHASVERQLPDHQAALEPLRLDDLGGTEDPDRHRQVEGRAFLAQVGGGEVDRDSIDRELEAGVSDGRPNAVAALTNRGVRQPHRGERRQARSHVHLDEDGGGFDAGQRGRAHPGEHAGSVGSGRRPVNVPEPIRGK